MKKTELIEAVAAKAGLTKKDAEKAVNAVLDSVVGAVAAGDKVTLVGFGTFESRKREGRVGQNPRTGEKIEIAATTVPAFKAGQAFKNAVAK
ncbi:MAG: HU family DNA-binding protein [Clostridia bacterium]|nr:HU family DNA-binding protein [Clostridia bacterium]MBQ2939865.1 HU family DNA-binding protein [Clostridia bacterium]